ncbi:inner membrane transporter ygji-related [Holotrichia oblita]|uniref:Inner membrane transporter ygji-related n=1 Tax=Holotrichia oblita TaxID=644536 RepID=A0ACB9TTB4_HOLOL|nr:inner membrane transporter ygji-related [Holotrichia oblita]
MSIYDDFGFVCIHWTLGGLVLIGLAASEYSGAGTVVALPIAGITVTTSALCGIYYKNKSTTKRQLSDIIHFLIIWFHIFELLMAAATCARVASATVDYTSEEKLRVWLFGLESHSLGEPWPDVLGVTIIAVITALFMLGLEVE